jgi:hypothetical protein
MGRICEILIGGRKIVTTPEHPFWVMNRGWVDAAHLEEGQLIASHDGQWTKVEAVDGGTTIGHVYNMRVAEWHTYFVGEENWGFSVWAHNANYAKGAAKSSPSQGSYYEGDGSFRTPDGKFAARTGVVPGSPAVDRAEAIINSREGYRVVGREISVRDADGTLRRYDLVATNPKGEYVGVEVKGGTASRTAQQRRVDESLASAGGLDTVGSRAMDAGIDRIVSVELLRISY